MSEPDIKWICHTSAEEGVAAIKRLLQKPITAKTLRTLEAAEQHESCRKDRRSSLLEALIRAATKVNKVLAAEKSAEIMARKSPSVALEMEVLPPASTALSTTSASVSQINALHNLAQGKAVQAKTLAEDAAHLAVLLGIRLSELKESLPHGEFGKLFEKDAAGQIAFEFTDRTAQRYLAVSKGLIEKHQLSDLQIKQLSRFAAEPEAITDKGRKMLARLTDGNTLRQLYLDLGIITGMKDKKGGPGGARIAGDATPEQILEAERKLATEDAIHIAEFIAAFVNSNKPTLLDKDHHTFLTDAVTQASTVLKRIKH